MTHDSVTSASRFEDVRARLVQRLGDHFAHDELTLDELEQRLARAYRAERPEELARLVADLPEPAPARIERVATSRAGRSPLSMAPKAPLPATAGALAIDSERESQKSIVAAMSGVVRRGRWTVPRHIDAFALMGGIELDLREANLSPEVTGIRVVAIMGGVTVRVAPGTRVETDGLAIMGTFEDPVPHPDARYDGPVVRITGFALMGGVETTIARAGDPVE